MFVDSESHTARDTQPTVMQPVHHAARRVSQAHRIGAAHRLSHTCATVMRHCHGIYAALGAHLT